MKIIFFGDSVSDAGRNHFDDRDLGSGYVKIAEGKLRLMYPDTEIVVLNRGVNGDRTEQLVERVQKDVIDEHPDIVVLQIGVNDAWHRFVIGVDVTPEQFRERYSYLVETIKKSGAQLVLLQPFVLPIGDKPRLRPYIDRFNAIISEIAKAEKVPLIPMDEIFTGVTQDIPPEQFAEDGVHPTHRGCRYIADQVIKEIKKYIQ